MKRINLIAGGLVLLLGTTAISCSDKDQRQESPLTEESTDATSREGARNINPASHVDPKDQTDPSLTGSGDVGDDTMVPSNNIVNNATTSKQLATFTSALKQANLVETLNGTGPYTVFAPTDEAFKALPEGALEDLMKPENKQRLVEVLNNHIVTGKLAAADMQDGAILKTSAGQQLKVSKKGDKVMVNGASVVEADGMSSNGVLHTIDKVLMPADK
ncbi:fasciclin domain-containing protein [Pontibacter ruber]|uniref:Fasciclin domain-containing protein n=1 Tax=Pontibacter ruber TaxID=1343895 RepID=A0ABW5D3L5_9BACT|nr:fasciclin domain-containing protein [Pontibacter ruber]